MQMQHSFNFQTFTLSAAMRLANSNNVADGKLSNGNLFDIGVIAENINVRPSPTVEGKWLICLI